MNKTGEYFDGEGLRLHPELPVITRHDIEEILDIKNEPLGGTTVFRQKDNYPPFSINLETNTLLFKTIDETGGMIYHMVKIKPETKFVSEFKKRYSEKTEEETRKEIEQMIDRMAAERGIERKRK